MRSPCHCQLDFNRSPKRPRGLPKPSKRSCRHITASAFLDLARRPSSPAPDRTPHRWPPSRRARARRRRARQPRPPRPPSSRDERPHGHSRARVRATPRAPPFTDEHGARGAVSGAWRAEPTAWARGAPRAPARAAARPRSRARARGRVSGASSAAPPRRRPRPRAAPEAASTPTVASDPSHARSAASARRSGARRRSRAPRTPRAARARRGAGGAGRAARRRPPSPRPRPRARRPTRRARRRAPRGGRAPARGTRVLADDARERLGRVLRHRAQLPARRRRAARWRALRGRAAAAASARSAASWLGAASASAATRRRARLTQRSPPGRRCEALASSASAPTRAARGGGARARRGGPRARSTRVSNALGSTLRGWKTIEKKRYWRCGAGNGGRWRRRVNGAVHASARAPHRGDGLEPEVEATVAVLLGLSERDVLGEGQRADALHAQPLAPLLVGAKARVRFARAALPGVDRVLQLRHEPGRLRGRGLRGGRRSRDQQHLEHEHRPCSSGDSCGDHSHESSPVALIPS